MALQEGEAEPGEHPFNFWGEKVPHQVGFRLLLDSPFALVPDNQLVVYVDPVPFRVKGRLRNSCLLYTSPSPRD